MNHIVQQFLSTQRISVVGILQSENSIHSATLHFAYSPEPFTFYFLTDTKSKKCKALLNGEFQNASLVIGFSEEEFKTFQAEGNIHITRGEERTKGFSVYTNKFPERISWQEKPDIALLKFIPTWWRYRDMKQQPMLEIESDKPAVANSMTS